MFLEWSEVPFWWKLRFCRHFKKMAPFFLSEHFTFVCVCVCVCVSLAKCLHLYRNIHKVWESLPPLNPALDQPLHETQMWKKHLTWPVYEPGATNVQVWWTMDTLCRPLSNLFKDHYDMILKEYWNIISDNNRIVFFPFVVTRVKWIDCDSSSLL